MIINIFYCRSNLFETIKK